MYTGLHTLPTYTYIHTHSLNNTIAFVLPHLANILVFICCILLHQVELVPHPAPLEPVQYFPIFALYVVQLHVPNAAGRWLHQGAQVGDDEQGEQREEAIHHHYIDQSTRRPLDPR